MSLATSCPACGTVFRVIEDQLKVSEGWVRCGQCQEVFNALEGLFDLDRPPPGTSMLQRTVDLPLPATTQAEEPPARPTTAPVAAADNAPDDDDSAWAPTSAAWLPPAVAPLPEPAPFLAEPAVESQEPSWTADPLWADPSIAPLETPPATEKVAAETPPLDTAEAGAPLPSFVVSAQREERWRHPLVRAGLVLAALCAASGLVLQLGWHYRDLLAARWAWTRPVLTSACAWQGCTLQPPRLLEALLVDNTTLTRPPGVDAYRLQVTLQNHAEFTVQAPHLELSLSDASGALLVRRVLSPEEFRRPAELATGESQWQLEFTSSERRFAGYTVAAFYP